MNIKIKIDPDALSAAMKEQVDLILNPKPVLRIVAFDVLSLVTARIHEEGKDASGQQIGNYTNRYLKVRQSKYKRSGDRKIIMSLTRQLENDWAVIETPDGWGIGFHNVFNVNKMKWNEERMNKLILGLTDEEVDYAVQRANEILKERLKA
jgi:hypothetical protein